jgi:hypothetical protein
MVFRGRTRDESAIHEGLQPDSLYRALRRPDVKNEYLRLCEVLRVSGRARRISRLEAIVEQDENKQAAVNAARALELMGTDEAARVSDNPPVLPGVVIYIGNEPFNAPPRTVEPVTIEAKANELSADDNDDNANDDDATE